MNYNGRFFAFGCSFTASGTRPTWADIVGRHFNEYQNWGRGGMGNQFIFNQLIECNHRNKFTNDDTVMIMWSSITREDRYIKEKSGWFGKGNIYWSADYPQDFIKNFTCERGYLIRDLAVIAAAKQLLKHWRVNYEMFAMMPIGLAESVNQHDSNNQDVYDLYKDVLADLKPSVYEVIFNSSNWNDKQSDFGAYVAPGIRDSHPDPKESLEYVSQVLPELEIRTDIVEWVENFKLGDYNPEYFHVQRF